MALRAYIYTHGLSPIGRARSKGVTTATGDIYVLIVWMDAWFHLFSINFKKPADHTQPHSATQVRFVDMPI